MLNERGRPTAPAEANAAPEHTFTANRGLQIEEPLIFEIGRSDITGVDLPAHLGLWSFVTVFAALCAAGH